MLHNKIVFPPGVESPTPEISSCPKCGADEEDFRDALGGITFCMKCGVEIKK
jgi:ribosomal protein L37AE/L43A